MATKDSYTASGKEMQRQADNSPAAIARAQASRHQDFLKARMDQIGRWVTQGVRPEALVRFVLMDLSTNEKLRQSTPESVYLALLACAVTGLEPGALKGEAYLVPFSTKGVLRAQFMPGWRGLVKQARRSREVLGIVANVVRERDTFDMDLGTSNSLTHKPAMSGGRGDVVGAYAIAQMTGGHREIEFMDIDDLAAVEKMATARGASDAWRNWPDQMQRKTPLRRLAKRLPLGADYYVGLALEQAASDGRDQKEVLDVMGPESTPADGNAPPAPSDDLPDNIHQDPT